MKDRLLQLLDLEQISPSKFADIIGVQRSSVSHVLSGRNNPSYDFLQKTLKAFPGLNASWLMMGEGTMYEQMGRKVPGNLFDAPSMPAEAQNPVEITDKEAGAAEIEESRPVSAQARTTEESTETAENTAEKGISSTQDEPAGREPETARKIVQVMVIYDDDTFRTFTPAQ